MNHLLHPISLGWRCGILTQPDSKVFLSSKLLVFFSTLIPLNSSFKLLHSRKTRLFFKLLASERDQYEAEGYGDVILDISKEHN